MRLLGPVLVAVAASAALGLVAACTAIVGDFPLADLSDGGVDAAMPRDAAGDAAQSEGGGRPDSATPDAPAESGAPDVGVDARTGCTMNTDCPPANPVCNTVTGICVQCLKPSDCPVLAACDPSTHKCGGTCDGVNSICNGGCCITGSCSAGTQATACGANGEKCDTSCQLGACSIVTPWNGGSCECAAASHCTGSSNGPNCVGMAGAQVCGCASDADCMPRKCIVVAGQAGGYCQ